MIKLIKKISALTIIVIATTVSTSGQSYVEKIREIADITLEKQAFQSIMTADSLGQRRGLNPEDPEFGMEYNLRNDNIELELSQTFDFPTVYVQRNRLSKLGIERIGLEYKGSMRELMLKISEQYINYIYCSKLVDLMSRNAELCKTYLEKIEKGVELRYNTRAELESFRMVAKEVILQHEMAKLNLQQSINTIRGWGYTGELPTEYPGFTRYSRVEFVERATTADISLQSAEVDSLIAERMLKLSRHEWIPKFSVGYKIEFEKHGSNNGSLMAGISIPLWHNRNNIKHSKALIKSAEKQRRATENSVKVNLLNLYSAFEATEQIVQLHPNNFGLLSELLEVSLQKESMKYSDFLITLRESYDVEEKFLTAEMEHAQNQAMMEILISEPY